MELVFDSMEWVNQLVVPWFWNRLRRKRTMVAGCGSKCLERGHRAHRTSPATCTCDNPTAEWRRYANCEWIPAINWIGVAFVGTEIREMGIYLAKIHGRFGWNERPFTRADFDSKFTNISIYSTTWIDLCESEDDTDAFYQQFSRLFLKETNFYLIRRLNGSST